MKNRWLKRIATAVTVLAVAAATFTGVSTGVMAAQGYYYLWDDDGAIHDGNSANGDILCFAGPQNSDITRDSATKTVTIKNLTAAHLSLYGKFEPGWTYVFEGTNEITNTSDSFVVDNDSTVIVKPGATLTVGKLNGVQALTLGDDTVATSMVEGATNVVFSNTKSADDKNTNSSSSDDSSSTHKHHTHNWEWTALVNATENQDGTYAMKCTRCNKVDESTITVIAKESVTSDKNLQALGSVKPGETIKLDTKGTAAFNQYFIAELMKHSDSPLEVDFEYKNEKWTLTAPAGFNWAATLDDKGWAGFLRVAGENEEVTAVKR